MPPRSHSARLFSAIVVAGSALGCSTTTDSSAGEDDGATTSGTSAPGTASDTNPVTESGDSDPTFGGESESESESESGGETGSMPKWDIGQPPDLPGPPDSGPYKCCDGDWDCTLDQFCSFDLVDYGICIPTDGTCETNDDCDIDNPGSAIPTCVDGTPSACVLGCDPDTLTACPDGLDCIDWGPVPFCAWCDIVPIG